MLAEIPWQIFLSPFGIPITAIFCAFAWLTISAIADAVAKVMCNHQNTELKLELLARGFTAQEIVGIVAAGNEAVAGDSEMHPTAAT